MRNQHLKKYGITAAHYKRLYNRQKGLCAICRQPEAKRHKSGEPFELAVDHNHDTGLVRGLLCGKCNAAIGLMDDDTERLRNAIKYLKGSTKAVSLTHPCLPTGRNFRIIEIMLNTYSDLHCYDTQHEPGSQPRNHMAREATTEPTRQPTTFDPGMCPTAQPKNGTSPTAPLVHSVQRWVVGVMNVPGVGLPSSNIT